jgi:acyl-coenzyme A synthetase/AMP-(fatty) acid ligase
VEQALLQHPDVLEAAVVKRTIAPYKYPRAIDFVTDLPKTPSGKIQHFRLRKLLAERSH